MSGITLETMLDARERRAERRKAMQAERPGPCVCLSCNIPGPEKDSPRIRELFQHAMERITTVLPVYDARWVQEDAGPHAVFAVTGAPASIKAAACRLEAEDPYARLLDIDVYAADGSPVASPQRGPGRPCFVCDQPAISCMREGRHQAADIAAAVEDLFTDFAAAMTRRISPPAAHYASLALEAMLHEAAAAPSPGLVDPFHTGSHKDMDFFTFLRSSAALAPGLARCVEAGLRHRGEAFALLPVLRIIGREAEKAMFCATEGVNTQKGLLFSLGLALGATGLLLRDKEAVSPAALSERLAAMTAGLVTRELGQKTSRELGQKIPRTAGEKAYRDFGIAGIRGELEAGLPSVCHAALPVLHEALARGEDTNRALIRTLITLMATVDDTTILSRSPHKESLELVKTMARDLIQSKALDRENWQDAVQTLDGELVRRNLSPGGSADLLAVTWYFHKAAHEAP